MRKQEEPAEESRSRIALGRYIRQVREGRRMSQKDLAEAIGVRDESTISRIESGQQGLALERAQQLANALAIDLGSLLLFYGKRPTVPESTLSVIERTIPEEARLQREVVPRTGGAAGRLQESDAPETWGTYLVRGSDLPNLLPFLERLKRIATSLGLGLTRLPTERNYGALLVRFSSMHRVFGGEAVSPKEMDEDIPRRLWDSWRAAKSEDAGTGKQ